MESSKDDADGFELHRSVFDNDLRKLNQIVKHNKEEIDRKVSGILRKRVFILSQRSSNYARRTNLSFRFA